MSYTTEVIDKAVLFYRDSNGASFIKEVDITGTRLSKEIKDSVPYAQSFKLYERCIKRCALGRHVSTFARIKLYRKKCGGKFVMVSSSSMTL